MIQTSMNNIFKKMNGVLKHPAVNSQLKWMQEKSIELWQIIQKRGINSYNQLEAYTEHWNQRKRYSMLGTIIILLFLMWYILFFSPLSASSRNNHYKISSIQRSIDELNKEAQTILEQAKQNPNQGLLDEIANVEENIKQKTIEIEAKTANQLAPPQLTQLLKTKIIQTDELKLLRLASLSAIRIMPSVQGSSALQMEKLPKIYNHPIEVDFQGDYFSTLRFLSSLKESWRLYWNSLQYVVTNYPSAKVSIRVHVLSKQESWDEL